MSLGLKINGSEGMSRRHLDGTRITFYTCFPLLPHLAYEQVPKLR